ncbi:MAG: glycosyltransferase, partial [Archaeoglobi archaeon]|nr:glycosyltransferase [Archaeoglobi archaeon]
MKVRILIPALNEEESIGDVIDGFRKLGYDNILVIDGHSTDRTREIAREKGAEVVVQSGKGKGQAVREAFEILDDDVVVMIDADGTYLPEDVELLLEPIRRGVADHVVGNRLVNFEKGAFTRLNLL